MRILRFLSISFVLCFGLLGCNGGAKPIAYGSDGCHFCSMTIVDQQHAAQLVTTKGKAYKFDAVECMMNHINKTNEVKFNQFLVNEYIVPGELIDATKATYLISKKLPSPMGEFLTAFATKEDAERAQAGLEGKLYTWSELQQYFKNK